MAGFFFNLKAKKLFEIKLYTKILCMCNVHICICSGGLLSRPKDEKQMCLSRTSLFIYNEREWPVEKSSFIERRVTEMEK